MDEDTGNVVAFNVVQVSEMSSSNAKEKEGFIRCIEMLEGKGVKITRVATDCHVSIASCMSKHYPQISHQYDVWHLSKWVVKKLTNKAKQKGCEELAPWIQSISNHLWWSAATSDGSVQMFWEKWKSVLDHVSNRHKIINGLETRVSTSAATDAFLPLKLRRSVGSRLVHQLT